MYIVTLCGSTKFKDEFMAHGKRLALAGHVVIGLQVFSHHDGDELTRAQENMLDVQHKRKIAMSDEIYVINRGGYIGKSTRSEIKFAHRLGLKVVYMEPLS